MIYGYARRGPQAASGLRFVEAHARAAEIVLPPGEYRLKHLPNLMAATRSRLGPTTSRGWKPLGLTLLGHYQQRGIGARTLAPTPGEELEPLPCTELNTIAERGPYYDAAAQRLDHVSDLRAHGRRRR